MSDTGVAGVRAATDLIGAAPVRAAGALTFPIAARALAEVAARAAPAGWRFLSTVGDDDNRLDVVLAAPGVRQPVVLRCVHDGEVPSIAPVMPAASWAERETADLFGVRFVGSPDARPLIHHEDWPTGLHPLAVASGDVCGRRVERVDGRYPFDHVEGEGVMEIRVGPIHAGIIEPGHFRFSAVGETVLGLEIRLGYVHRGVERAARGLTPAALLVLAERISGTASVAHSVAAARALEHALDVEVPPAHAACRTLLIELERFFNHVGDLGNLCAGTALAGILAEGLILKEALLEANGRLTGSRYLRNLVTLGGVRRLPTGGEVRALLAAVERVAAGLEPLAAKFFGSATNLERLTGTGVLSPEHARALGTVGVVARGSGVAVDSRVDFDFASAVDRDLYAGFAPALDSTCDVAARARVRLSEARASFVLIGRLAALIADGGAAAPGRPSRAGGEGWGLCEGARGEHVTYARVVDGRVARLRVRSPSRMNWPAIEHAMPGNIVPDFPLINKSFNLSYAGCDL